MFASMRPSALLLLLLLLACGALLLLLACGEEKGGPTPPAATAAPRAAPQAASPQGPDRAWWQQTPPVSLFFSGGQLGKLKPCGCSEPQMGGLKRLASVMQQFRIRTRRAEGAWAALSLGWSMRGNGERQEEAKADLLRAVHEALGYEATLLGATDLTVDAMCQQRAEGGPDAPHPPINARLAQVNPAVDATPFVDVQVGGQSVRAVSVLEPQVAADMQAGGFLDGIVSISRALEALQPRPDTLWVVAARLRDEGTLETLAASLRRLGGGVILDLGAAGLGRRRVDRAAVRPDGDPLVLELGDLGKAVGILDVERNPSGGWLLSYRHIELVPEWEKLSAPDQGLMDEVEQLDRLYRAMVRDGGYLDGFQRHEFGGATYLGSSACAGCHRAIYLDWRKTPHAVALETLERQEYDWDPECIRCHVVGWQRSDAQTWIVARSGFANPEKTPFLGGVGCESCHGPGSAHVEAPWDEALFDPGRGGPNVARPPRALCAACHDVENSHGFLEGYEASFLPRVDHRVVPADRRTTPAGDR